MLFFIQNYQGMEFFVVALSYILVVVFSLSMHEFAHAFVAYKCGDSTPKMEGRVTLNPLKHIDPIGIICCALFGFGWANPVKINSTQFRNIKKGTIWTSISGVLMNIILAFLGYGLFLLTLLIRSNSYLVIFVQQLCYFLFLINLSLAVFNILPIYPLDGFKVVEATTKYNNKYVQFMYRYGNLVLVLLLVFFDGILYNFINLISYPIIWFWNLIF